MASVAEWLPAVRASAVGWIPIARQPIKSSQTTSGSGPETGSDVRVRLNVSGQRFETFARTLARFPDTLLGSEERTYFYDVGADEYFFDRNPALFRHVLTYYRSGRLHFPREECVAEFNDELEFFGIKPTDAVPECCFVSIALLWLQVPPAIPNCSKGLGLVGVSGVRVRGRTVESADLRNGRLESGLHS